MLFREMCCRLRTEDSALLSLNAVIRISPEMLSVPRAAIYPQIWSQSETQPPKPDSRVSCFFSLSLFLPLLFPDNVQLRGCIFYAQVWMIMRRRRKRKRSVQSLNQHLSKVVFFSRSHEVSGYGDGADVNGFIAPRSLHLPVSDSWPIS